MGAMSRPSPAFRIVGRCPNSYAAVVAVEVGMEIYPLGQGHGECFRRGGRLSPIVLTAIVLAAACCATALPTQAQSVEEFYRTHPVNLVIGFPVANAYDTYGRAVARHLGKHIPGNPSVIPINRPGAGSLTAANYLYNTAPKDGSTIATFNRSVPLEPLMGNTTARFDAKKMLWLGSVGSEASVCVAWHTAAVKNLDDLLTKNFIAGAAAMSADTGVFPQVLNSVFGSKIKIITGYPGGAEMSLAMEKGEIDGRCGWSWSGVKSQKPEWLAQKQINILAQIGLQKSDEMPDVPLIIDRAKTDDQRQLLKVVFSRQEFAWPFAAPPDLPQDRRQALLTAFDATLKDPEFLEDAKKLQIDINPISGAAVEKLIGDLYQTPDAITAKVRAIVNPQ
jgi:tripartite-type tricarboxylate transporter receptor subunit TctC